MTAPRIRAGDADRQQSVDRLARHFTQGRLYIGEYDERVRAVYASVYLDELPVLFGDLPAEPIDAHRWSPQSGYGLVGRPASLRYRGRSLMERSPHILLLMLAVLWIAVVAHGFFFPVPLILIVFLRFNAVRRGYHHAGPGSRR